ncbi:MAG: hypothetical protein AAF307_03735 [Pseudomonadota bacterium]
MNTWTSKASGGALALLALAGCDANLAGLGLGGAGSSNTALTEATLALGAVTLQPPSGYCVDSATLTARYATMARCDRLGLEGSDSFAPVGVITASAIQVPGEGVPDAKTLAAAFDLEPLSTARSTADTTILRVRAAKPRAGMDQEHWRAAARIGGHVLGLALYAPEDSASEIVDGDQTLADIIAAARTAE